MRYSYTDEALERIRWAGLEPADVLRALNTTPQHVRYHGEDISLMTVRARSGLLHIAVGLREKEGADDEWDVVGARRMDKDEIAVFERLTGGRE